MLNNLIDFKQEEIFHYVLTHEINLLIEDEKIKLTIQWFFKTFKMFAFRFKRIEWLNMCFSKTQKTSTRFIKFYIIEERLTKSQKTNVIVIEFNSITNFVAENDDKNCLKKMKSFNRNKQINFNKVINNYSTLFNEILNDNSINFKKFHHKNQIHVNKFIQCNQSLN